MLKTSFWQKSMQVLQFEQSSSLIMGYQFWDMLSSKNRRIRRYKCGLAQKLIFAAIGGTECWLQ